MTKKSDTPFSHPLNVDLLINAEQPDETYINVSLNEIQTNPQQPRHYFDEEKITLLAGSIQEHGILQPLLVRPKNESGHYPLIAGERRYRAAQLLNLETVPVAICAQSEPKILAISLVENLQRENLNPIEETEGMLSLLSLALEKETQEVMSLLYRMQNEAKKKVTHNVMGNSEVEQVESIFNTVGTVTWQSFVNNRLPLLKLPEDILDALRQGKIEYTKAKEIAKLKDEAQRTELLQKAIADSLSLSQIKARLQELKPQKEIDTPQSKIQQLGKQLSQKKLWVTDKRKWKKIEGWLNKIESLLSELDDTIDEENELTDSNPGTEPSNDTRVIAE